MAKGFRFAVKATVPVAACFLAIWLAGVARAQDKVQLSGHWNFNVDQSDDAKQKVTDAQQNSKITASNNGNTYPGSGGGYPGGGGGWPGGMGRGGMGGGGGGMGRGRQGTQTRSSVSDEEWDRLAANPQYLHIDQRSDQIVITDDSNRAQTFYPDGKKHDEKDEDGKKYSTKASWESGVFIAETKLPHSEKLTQTFRVSDDGKHLYVTTEFEAPSLNGPLSIRRVYDMPNAPAPSAK
jgi:hypothetical protein